MCNTFYTIIQIQIIIYFSYLQIVMQLPEIRRTVFLYISSFLQELLSHTQDNELDAKTLGKIILIHITSISVLLITLRGQTIILFYFVNYSPNFHVIQLIVVI